MKDSFLYEPEIRLPRSLASQNYWCEDHGAAARPPTDKKTGDPQLPLPGSSRPGHEVWNSPASVPVVLHNLRCGVL